MPDQCAPTPTCPTHPTVRLTCPACTGGLGGKVSSPAKTQAAQRNIAKRWAQRPTGPLLVATRILKSIERMARAAQP